MSEASDDHAEILRLRERSHALEASAQAYKFLLDDLREWRAEARLQIASLERTVGDVTTSAEIAEAVADKMRTQRGLHLTLLQKLAAGAVGAVALADGIKGLIG